MDTLITGGTVVTTTEAIKATIGIKDGRIAAILGPDAALPTATEVIDATGLVIMPGAIDVHTHFTGSHDKPEEELIGGTLGAAIGGITTVVEMPHSGPPATTLDAFLWKKALLSRSSTVDFALWGGLDGKNLGELAKMDAEGAIAFKAFLCSADPQGAATDEKGLPRLDDDGLLRAMKEIRSFDGLIGIHSENHDILIGAGQELRKAGRHDVRAHAESGPEVAEIEAVARVATLAGETGVRCHVVHVSSGKAAKILFEAKKNARVTLETCPHYLILDEDDLVRIGPNARCGPPLRPRPVIEALWDGVKAGEVDMLASDHCPYMPEQKAAGATSIWEAGMGLAGIETSVPMFMAAGLKDRGLSLVDLARMSATAPAGVFGLSHRKGRIGIGMDADLALYDMDRPWTVEGGNFQGYAKWSAFEGMTCGVTVMRTLVRGETVHEARKACCPRPGFGQFLRRGGFHGA
ncbi:dihydroorotase [Rhizobium halophytocola]|uniref:Allantoinase n=1 Tax=Rhizobium halophytocola TaxID=735519 RepID=A0ABS4DUG0_9HYPH|nr:dihydroorotase [Rhizobium halophytocola]MBP1849307.1 allantoinase [Rhizobium halophytocola]